MQGRWTVKADLSGFLRIAAEGGKPSASDSEDDSILSHSLREGRCEGTTQPRRGILDRSVRAKWTTMDGAEG